MSVRICFVLIIAIIAPFRSALFAQNGMPPPVAAPQTSEECARYSDAAQIAINNLYKAEGRCFDACAAPGPGLQIFVCKERTDLPYTFAECAQPFAAWQNAMLTRSAEAKACYAKAKSAEEEQDAITKAQTDANNTQANGINGNTKKTNNSTNQTIANANAARSQAEVYRADTAERQRAGIHVDTDRLNNLAGLRSSASSTDIDRRPLIAIGGSDSESSTLAASKAGLEKAASSVYIDYLKDKLWEGMATGADDLAKYTKNGWIVSALLPGAKASVETAEILSDGSKIWANLSSSDTSKQFEGISDTATTLGGKILSNPASALTTSIAVPIIIGFYSSSLDNFTTEWAKVGVDEENIRRRDIYTSPAFASSGFHDIREQTNPPEIDIAGFSMAIGTLSYGSRPNGNADPGVCEAYKNASRDLIDQKAHAYEECRRQVPVEGNPTRACAFYLDLWQSAQKAVDRDVEACMAK